MPFVCCVPVHGELSRTRRTCAAPTQSCETIRRTLFRQYCCLESLLRHTYPTRPAAHDDDTTLHAFHRSISLSNHDVYLMVSLFQPDVFWLAAAEAAAAGGAGDVHHRALRRFGARRRKQIPPGNQPKPWDRFGQSGFGVWVQVSDRFLVNTQSPLAIM